MKDKLEKIEFFKALQPLLNQSCLTSKGIYNLIRFFKQCTMLTKLAAIIKAELVAQPALEVHVPSNYKILFLCHDSVFWGFF